MWCDLDLTLLKGPRPLKSCPGYFWETISFRKMILGRDIGWGCRCAISWYNIGLTFDIATVTLAVKILSELYRNS